MPLVSDGGALKLIALEALPRLAPVKLTVAPAPRVRLLKVSDAVWPLPALDETVELPAPRVSEPADCDEPAAPLPRKLNMPPLSATVPPELRRLVLFAAVLSRVSVPPVLTVTVVAELNVPLAPAS